MTEGARHVIDVRGVDGGGSLPDPAIAFDDDDGRELGYADEATATRSILGSSMSIRRRASKTRNGGTYDVAVTLGGPANVDLIL